MKGDLQEILYRTYEKSIGKGILEVKEEKRRSPEVGQVRMFWL